MTEAVLNLHALRQRLGGAVYDGGTRWVGPGPEGDVALILARRRLTTSPAPMKQLGIFSGLQLTWWQVINSALSPHALRLEVLIARYISVADAAMLAALQRLEICQFMDMLRGQLGFDDDIILEVFWRSLLQSVAALDKELENAVAQHDDRGAVLGPASYIDLAIQFLADGIKPHSA